MHKFVRNFILGAAFWFCCACDPEGKKACEWYLVPEESQQSRVSPGYVPLCARNYRTKKQDCRLQAKLEDAKSYYQKKFRYVDLVVVSPALPREIKSITFCEE